MLYASQTKAREIMRSDVVTLTVDDGIQSALGVLEEARIGGAPVIDAGGRLVGVLTLSDIARIEHLSGDRLSSQRGGFEMPEPSGGDDDSDEPVFSKEDYSIETLGGERVGDWMTHEVISVEPEASLREVCNVMVGQRIHRVFVTQGRKLVGVVSSFDIVRWIALSTAKHKEDAS